MLTGELRAEARIAGEVLRAHTVRQASSVIAQGIPAKPARGGVVIDFELPELFTVEIGPDHGLVEGEHVDIYWSAGRRYACYIGAVTETAIYIEHGMGDGPPALGTVVTVDQWQVIDLRIDGDRLIMALMTLGERGLLHLLTNFELVKLIDLAPDGIWSWAEGGKVPNPLAGLVIDGAILTQAGTEARTLRLALLYDGLG